MLFVTQQTFRGVVVIMVMGTEVVVVEVRRGLKMSLLAGRVTALMVSMSMKSLPSREWNDTTKKTDLLIGERKLL